jgi:hypothetical protein
MIEKQEYRTIYPIHVCRFLQNARIWSFFAGKNKRFDSRWSNDSLQAHCLGALPIDVLIYAERIKSETDLRKMVKIIEELLKIKKYEKDTFSHAQPFEKNEKKSKHNI